MILRTKHDPHNPLERNRTSGRDAGDLELGLHAPTPPRVFPVDYVQRGQAHHLAGHTRYPAPGDAMPAEMPGGVGTAS